jgi:hypothetical protein
MNAASFGVQQLSLALFDDRPRVVFKQRNQAIHRFTNCSQGGVFGVIEFDVGQVHDVDGAPMFLVEPPDHLFEGWVATIIQQHDLVGHPLAQLPHQAQ